MHLVHDPSPPGEALEQSLRQLEAHVEPVRPDVEQQVAGCRDGGMPGTSQRAENVQAGRARVTEEAVPQLRAETDHARQPPIGDAKTHRPGQA